MAPGLFVSGLETHRACAGRNTFSHNDEPATGDFADAVVIRTFGEVPSMEELLGIS